jgi:hypothetical protein
MSRSKDQRSHKKGVSPQKRLKLPPSPSATSGTGNFPDFIYNGGPVINTPQVYALFVGDWSSTSNQSRANRLQQFITDFLNSRYMNILSQYGCGTSGNLVNSVFISSSDHDLSTSDIHNIIQTAINNNQIPEPTNLSNCCILFLDDATGVNDATAGAVMCEATSDNAFGYHHFFTTTAGNVCPFAVVPGLDDTCLTNSCSVDSGCSLHLAQSREARQTQVASHELSEMFSDPQVLSNFGWNSASQGENGDICNGNSGTITVGANTWTVQLMYSKWHDMQTSGGTTCVSDVPNPLPSLLPACNIILDRSTFGKDEVDALLHQSNPAVIEAAFYVVVDGFTPAQLGITPASLIGVPNVSPAVTISPNISGMAVTPTGLIAEDPSLGGGIQRFTWVYRVTFSNSSGFPTSVGAVTPVTLSASIARVSAPIVTASGSAMLQLIHEPNPYELDGSVSWLSTDLRVFQINAGDSKLGVTMGSSAAADAPAFIQQVIANLNNGMTSGQTFENDISTDEETTKLELSETVNGTPVFNFAIAKIRYRSLLADAPNVRVFFRLFPASTTSTDFNQATTYRRGGQSGFTIPLLGIVGGATTTIPCFAAARIDSTAQSMNAQTDQYNVKSISHDASGNEVSAYFGCWLDINQPSQPRFPINPGSSDGPFASSGLQTIQQLIRNAHQCLVAEIAFDPDQIPNGASPGSSDKLAQRNLSIVASDNPGSSASHTIPNTFEVHLSSVALPKNSLPDELLFDWTGLPQGSSATIYVPGTSTAAIIEIADELYSSHGLHLIDAQTLGCTARGFTFVPVPQGSIGNLPGLLTITLPATVRKGQSFKIVVRQITNAAGKRVPAPKVGGREGAEERGSPTAEKIQVIRWRRILGSYQISIPVKTANVLLGPEERLLSVLKWIRKSIPPSDRWFLVFDRYVNQIADRVKALGGNPDLIQPSPKGEWQHGKGETELCITGKICEVVFDCFGSFEGFVLETCSEQKKHLFKSREPDIAKLTLQLCKDHMLATICYDEDDPERVEKIIVRCC